MFVYLEGTWHPMGESEHTTCGIVVPHGTDWVRELPEGEDLHYGDSGETAEAPPKKPKAKKG